MNSVFLADKLLATIPWSWRRRIRALPGVSAVQRIFVAAALDGEEFVHEVDAGPARGVKFAVRMPEDKGIWTGTYEAEFAAAVAAAVRPGSVAYDIGGWHGFFAGLMAAQGARETHVFEPLPENAFRIARLVRLNPRFDIRLHQCALGDEDGQIELLVAAQTSMAKISSSAFQPDAAADRRHRVELARIDTLVARGEIVPPDIVKMDVEGAEALVLRGATNVLEKHGPAIFAEVHSRALLEECSSLLARLGYAVAMIEGDAWTSRSEIFQVRAVRSIGR